MKIESVVKVKKHIPYKLLKFIIKMKKPKRDVYTLSVDYSKDYPLGRIKSLLIEHSDAINGFMETVENNNYEDLQTEDEIEEFKKKLIDQIIHFFRDKELVEIFEKIEVMNFNTKYDDVLSQMPGVVLKTSKKLSTVYTTKEDCLKVSEDLRYFFERMFLFKSHHRVYGSYESLTHYDFEKIKLFYERNVLSKDLINEILKEERKRYFQKYDYSRYYFGVVSYQIIKEEWNKLKK